MERGQDLESESKKIKKKHLARWRNIGGPPATAPESTPTTTFLAGEEEVDRERRERERVRGKEERETM